jgi:hypothetical protein
VPDPWLSPSRLGDDRERSGRMRSGARAPIRPDGDAPLRRQTDRPMPTTGAGKAIVPAALSTTFGANREPAGAGLRLPQIRVGHWAVLAAERKSAELDLEPAKALPMRESRHVDVARGSRLKRPRPHAWRPCDRATVREPTS